MDIKYETYDEITNHPFIRDLLQQGIKISSEVIEHNGFKVESKYKREPIEKEFYCLQLGHSISHLLTVIQQMEHTIYYMSNFSPTGHMKKAGITKHNHLLWSVENYIIRTQTAYDRLLIAIDRLFNIQNTPGRISHEAIVSNLHIKRTPIPKLLKPIKNSVKKYYHDRNTIIHQNSFLEDELHAIEAYTILSMHDDENEQTRSHLKQDLKWSTRDYINKKKREYSRVNKNLIKAIAPMFNEMHAIYKKKFNEL